MASGGHFLRHVEVTHAFATRLAVGEQPWVRKGDGDILICLACNGKHIDEKHLESSKHAERVTRWLEYQRQSQDEPTEEFVALAPLDLDDHGLATASPLARYR